VSDSRNDLTGGATPLQADLVVTNATAILGGANGEQYRVVPGTSIEVAAGEISWIGPTDSGRATRAAKVVDAKGRIAVAGLVSTHNHAFQNLCKGIGDELAVWPIVEGVILATAEEMNVEEIYIASLACCIEGMRSGRTTLLDFMVGLPDIEHQRAVLRAFRDSGVRGLLGRATRELHHEVGRGMVALGEREDSQRQPLAVRAVAAFAELVRPQLEVAGDRQELRAHLVAHVHLHGA